jgi:hypothetical protein
MVIFHSYVSLPEGKIPQKNLMKNSHDIPMSDDKMMIKCPYSRAIKHSLPEHLPFSSMIFPDAHLHFSGWDFPVHYVSHNQMVNY